MKRKKAIIFGVTGQDGSYLSNLLLKKKYQVFGITRSKNKENLKNLDRFKITKKIKLLEVKKFDQKKIDKVIKKLNPEEIYYLAGQSSVGNSFIDPIETYLSNNSALFFILESILESDKKIKFSKSLS